MVGVYDPSETYEIPLWDNNWIPGTDFTFVGGSDWRVDIPNSDLANESALHTAVVMLLFTDRRAPTGVDLPGEDGDRRGWWGDYVDIRIENSEQEMGSLLWLRERSILTDNSEREIQTDCEIALTPLIQQGAVAEFVVNVNVDKRRGSALIQISLFSQNGDLRYQQRFHRIWQQTHPELI